MTSRVASNVLENVGNEFALTLTFTPKVQSTWGMTVAPPNLTMIDLFAGCGGLSLGMENAGFTPVFVSELNQDAMATYLANRHHEVGGLSFADQSHLRCHDAHDLQGDRLEKLVEDLRRLGISLPSLEESKAGTGESTLDLIAGGPPCQGYSGIGHRRSYAVEKEEIPSNQLYQRMASIIARLRPRIFLFENVRGLLKAKWNKGSDRRIWNDVVDEFKGISGYHVRWSLVYASDYGVPQNRPRVLLVGIRDDVIDHCRCLDLSGDDAVASGFLPKPSPMSFPTIEELLGDLVDPRAGKILKSGQYPKGHFETKKYPSEPQTATQTMLRRAPPAHESRSGLLTDHQYSKHSPRIVEKFQHMLSSGSIPENARTRKFSQRVLRAKWPTGRPTITATSMPDDYVHYSQPRTLTVREWARLQLFPDWYQFVGKRTTGGLRRAGNPLEGNFDREVPKYTQIGNAVPVGLAQSVGEHFRRLLEIHARGNAAEKAADEPLVGVDA